MLWARSTTGSDLLLAVGAPEHRIAHFGKPPVTARVRAELREARRRVGDLLAACLDEITRSQPDVVGFTARLHQLSASLALAQRVKAALPAACVVLGGASCRGEMGDELLRSFPFLDDVVDGEGEDALPDIVIRYEDRRLPSGLANLERGAVTGEPHALCREKRQLATDLNALPYPVVW